MNDEDRPRPDAVELVDPQGKPARAARASICPHCGSGPDRRVASSGFGVPHPICGHCGYEFHGERLT